MTDDAIAKTSRVRISARTNRNEREFDPRFANAFRYIGGKFPICVKWLLRKWYLKIVWPDFNYLRFYRFIVPIFLEKAVSRDF